MPRNILQCRALLKSLLPPTSLILLFLLLKNVTTSSKTGSGDLPARLRWADRAPPPSPAAATGSGGSYNRRDTLFIKGEIMPTAAAIEPAGWLAADLVDYIDRTCQVGNQTILYTVCHFDQVLQTLRTFFKNTNCNCF